LKIATLLGGGIKGHVFEKISSLENLFLAWNEFKKGKSQRTDMQTYSVCLEDNLFELQSKLASGEWVHGGYETFLVHDPKLRQIHKASVADRILHHAVWRVLEPIFEKNFIFDSWSCRVDKGTHNAVRRLHSQLQKMSYVNRGTVWILKCDIKKYFANIDHDILFNLLGKNISDKDTLSLLNKIINSFTPGIPLGNLTSQLFANIYLNQLDHFVKEKLKIKIYLRYCDDFVLVSNSKTELLEMVEKIDEFLKIKLKLTLHPNKVFIRPFHHGLDWLGSVLYPDHIVLRPKTRKRMWRNIERKTRLYLSGLSSADTLFSISMSYCGMLKHYWNREDERKIWELIRCV